MANDPRILVIYAHPTPHKSRVHRMLADAARALPGVLVHDLYDTYPDFYINAEQERELAGHAEALVFLHPIRWYSVPSLLKEWLDVVMVPGWAYGRGGAALRGKRYWLVATTGSPADAYQPGGMHGRPFRDFLAPFEQTAALCGMEWIEPHVLHGASDAGEAALDAHVAAFRGRLDSLLTATG